MSTTAQVMAFIDIAAQWGPALPLALPIAVAIIEAVVLPRRVWAKGAWVLAVALCGVGAATLSRSQQHAERTAMSGRLDTETAALRGLWSQLDTLSRTLPPPPAGAPAARFDTVGDALASLSAKAAGLGTQIAALKADAKGRVVDDETAARLADYLRQFGSYRVVVSCPPSDVEAYTYANQLANILRAAGWDANGPEATNTVDEGPAMGGGLYVRDPAAPDAAKILVDALGRFNIPYRSGIAKSEAIPDQATVELHVAKKP